MQASHPLEWVQVPGGLAAYGDRCRPILIRDLWWTTTPVALNNLARWPYSDHPVTGITWFEAVAIAETLGGRLPTSSEWEWMASGPDRRRYPWGDEDWSPSLANLAPLGLNSTSSVGSFPSGRTPEGILDVAGNVWEWTSSKLAGAGAIIRGGSFSSQTLYARTTFLNGAQMELSSAGIGVRVVRET